MESDGEGEVTQEQHAQRPVGPYLKAAVICENVIEDKQGVLSLIRVVDRVIRGASGPAAQVPEQMQPFDHHLFLCLMFVSGEALGSQELTLVMAKPSGLRDPMTSSTLLFEGQDRGANVVLEMQLRLELEGLYWIEVHLGGEIVTRLPLRVVYQRQTRQLPGL